MTTLTTYVEQTCAKCGGVVSATGLCNAGCDDNDKVLSDRASYYESTWKRLEKLVNRRLVKRDDVTR